MVLLKIRKKSKGGEIKCQNDVWDVWKNMMMN